MVNARGSLGRLDLFYSEVPNRRGVLRSMIFGGKLLAENLLFLLWPVIHYYRT